MPDQKTDTANPSNNPDTPVDKGLSIQDLRTIIHSLKMHGLSFLEPEVLEQVQAEISTLPSSEELGKLEGNEKALNDVRGLLGHIMTIMDYYGNKGKEFGIRYKSVRKLPPRYKVLEWRKACAKQIVKMSKTADDKNLGKLSESLIDIVSGEINEHFFEKVADVIIDMDSYGMKIEASELHKMAQQGFNSTVIVQNPGQPSNPTSDLTNLNEAKRAFSYFADIVNKLEEAKVGLTDLETMLDVPEMNLVQQVENMVKDAMTKTKAYTFLTHMKKLTNVNDLFNQGILSQQLSLIDNVEIPGIAKQQAATGTNVQNQNQQAGQPG